jgi:hypothetical protein
VERSPQTTPRSPMGTTVTAEFLKTTERAMRAVATAIAS